MSTLEKLGVELELDDPLAADDGLEDDDDGLEDEDDGLDDDDEGLDEEDDDCATAKDDSAKATAAAMTVTDLGMDGPFVVVDCATRACNGCADGVGWATSYRAGRYP